MRLDDLQILLQLVGVLCNYLPVFSTITDWCLTRIFFYEGSFWKKCVSVSIFWHPESFPWGQRIRPSSQADHHFRGEFALGVSCWSVVFRIQPVIRRSFFVRTGKRVSPVHPKKERLRDREGWVEAGFIAGIYFLGLQMGRKCKIDDK